MLLIFILPTIIKKEKTEKASSLNLLVTMLLGGFWHGASWNFIIWGAMHGIALAVHRIWITITGKSLDKVNNRWWYKAIAVLITFHFVCFGWIFFKTASFSDASNMIHQITHDFSFSVWVAFFDNYKSVLGMIGLALVLHAVPDDYAGKMISRFQKIPLVAYITVFFLFVIVYGFFKAAEPVMPIYLQF